MENIADLFGALFGGAPNCAGDRENDCGCDRRDDGCGSGFDFGDFSGMNMKPEDLDCVLKLAELFAEFNKPDKNTMLLDALCMHMKVENREKIENAKKIAKIAGMLPKLREAGLF